MIGRRLSLAVFFAQLALPALPPAAAAAEALRDPMQPPALALQKFREARLARDPRKSNPVKTTPPVPFRLKSVLVGSERSIAIIDDQMLGIGDSIRGARLISLTRDSARLVQRGRIINLKLDDGAGATISKKAVEDKP